MSEISLIEKFKDQLTKVNGHCFLFNDVKDAILEIEKLCENANIKKMVINTQIDISKKIYNYLKSNSSILIESIDDLRFRKNTLKEELKDVGLGISCANYLIADTGTVVLISSKDEPRTLSLIPEFHIVLAKADCLVEKVEDALQVINDEVCITFITGPSRTADIEKVLITGVHGPKKFFVYIFGP